MSDYQTIRYQRDGDIATLTLARPGKRNAAAATLAARLAAQPPIAVRGARRAIDAAWHHSPEDSFRVALEEQIRCLQSRTSPKPARRWPTAGPPGGAASKNDRAPRVPGHRPETYSGTGDRTTVQHQARQPGTGEEHAMRV